MIHALIATLSANEACVWEDKADIDLNRASGLTSGPFGIKLWVR